MDKRQFLKLAPAAALCALAGGGFAPAFAQMRPDPIRAIRAGVVGGGALAEVETESGLVGHGFTAITNLEIVADILRGAVAENLIGQDALAREAVFDRLQRLLVMRGLHAGHAMHAISAVDIALWDIAGKTLDMPVWRLLGGARAVVPAYTTFGPATLDRDALVQAARDNSAAGARRLKMVVAAGDEPVRLAGGTMEEVLREDAARIGAVREAVGPDIEIFIDANHGLDEYEARRFIGDIAELDVALFEEPLRGNDIRRLADLRRHSPIPLSAGQNEGHIARWRDMAVNDAVDVLQFNVCMCGGYTGALKIAGLAEAFAMPIDNGGGYALFNMHLHAGVSNGGMIEWHVNSVALERQIYDTEFALEGDRLRLPEGPGLGFNLRPEIRAQLA